MTTGHASLQRLQTLQLAQGREREPGMNKTVQISGKTHEDLRTNALRIQFELGRQISMGSYIAAALRVANNHADELKDALGGEEVS